MINIEEKKELHLENVLSYRALMTQGEIHEEMQKIDNFLSKMNIRKNGPLMTTTFDSQNNQAKSDVELLQPIANKIEVDLPEKYMLKNEFKLVNAIYSRYIGHPQNFQGHVNQIDDYIKNNNINRITTPYIVSVTQPKSHDELNEMIIDCYIGVNPSIL